MTNNDRENGETSRRFMAIGSRFSDLFWLPGVRHPGLSRADLSMLISTGEYTLTDLGDHLQVTRTDHYRDDPDVMLVSTFDASGRLVRHERTNRFPWVFSISYDEVGRVTQRRYYGGVEHNFREARFEYSEGEPDDHYTIVSRNLERGEWEHLV